MKCTLKRNLYPKKLVETLIQRAIDKSSRQPVERVATAKIDKPIVAVPYVKGLFEKLKFACREEFVVVGKGMNTLKKSIFSKLKDGTPKMMQSNLVYEVTCSCGYKYVGQTCQLLRKRLYQHRKNIKKLNEEHSALCKHAIQERHTPLWDDTKILYREVVEKKRDILEMIAIKKAVKASNCVNKQTDSVMLSIMYNNLI